MIIPGLIDAHTHGAFGVDVNAADAEGLRTIARFFATQGTTGWLASVLTDTEETTRACLSAIRQVMREGSGGAQLLGVGKPIIKAHGAANADSIKNTSAIMLNVARNKAMFDGKDVR